MTPEERESIINEAVQRAILSLPEIVGNLVVQNTLHTRLSAKLYKDYPEFRGKNNIVADVVEMVDSENPTLDYGEILKKAVPRIRERISAVKNMDVLSISSAPKIDFAGEI